MRQYKSTKAVNLWLTASLGLILLAVVLVSFLPFAKETLFGKIFPKKISKAATTDTSYTKGLLVLKYFPTRDGIYLDAVVTGIQNGLLSFYKDKVVGLNNNLQSAIKESSSYLKFQNPAALNSLEYLVVATFSYDQTMPLGNPVPWNPGWYRPDYFKILTDHNICDWVENKGVREVWIWGYHGGQTEPVEGNMAGPWGDISNSERTNDMPTCKITYVLYNYNYGRDTAEALESWGHQIEAEMDAIDRPLFRDLWQGPNYPQTLGVNGRCGSVHNPPNARWEYDRSNPTPQKSDCLDWNADNPGTLSDISCSNWGCSDLNYMIWNWQNLPGRNNTKTYQGKSLRNWWDVHGDFDNVMANNRSLTLPGDTTPPTVSITTPTDGSTVARNTAIQISAQSSDNVGVAKVEFRVNNSLKCTDTRAPYSCSWKVPGKPGTRYTLNARAQDGAGNTSSSSINVTSSR